MIGLTTGCEVILSLREEGSQPREMQSCPHNVSLASSVRLTSILWQLFFHWLWNWRAQRNIHQNRANSFGAYFYTANMFKDGTVMDGLVGWGCEWLSSHSFKGFNFWVFEPFVNDYHQIPFKFRVFEPFVHSTFTERSTHPPPHHGHQHGHHRGHHHGRHQKWIAIIGFHHDHLHHSSLSSSSDPFDFSILWSLCPLSLALHPPPALCQPSHY